MSYIRAGRLAPGVLEFVSHLRPTFIGELSGRRTPRVESFAALYAVLKVRALSFGGL